MKNGLLRDYFPKLSHYRADAAAITQRAEEEAAATQKNIIRNQTQAYIQNKADALGCQLSVTVTLSSDAPYRPIAAVLQGNASPSAKAELTQWIRENFQLTGEVLTWQDS